MKQIILYALLVILAVGFCTSAYFNIKQSTELKSAKKTVENQQILIKEIAAMETVAIKIENVFKTNNVLGKTTVSAQIENNARQVATILKGELLRDTITLNKNK